MLGVQDVGACSNLGVFRGTYRPRDGLKLLLRVLGWQLGLRQRGTHKC